MSENSNYTPIDTLSQKALGKTGNNSRTSMLLVALLLLVLLPVFGLLIYQRFSALPRASTTTDNPTATAAPSATPTPLPQTSSTNPNSPDVPRWCRPNSFKGTISAPSTVTADTDGSFSFTATSSITPDEVCATINKDLNKNTIPGIPGATRATTCIDPLLTSSNCTLQVSWGGRYGTNPKEFEVSGELTGSSCPIYLLAIRGVPTCAKGNAVVVKAPAASPSPTPPVCELPTVKAEIVCPLCNVPEEQ